MHAISPKTSFSQINFTLKSIFTIFELPYNIFHHSLSYQTIKLNLEDDISNYSPTDIFRKNTGLEWDFLVQSVNMLQPQYGAPHPAYRVSLKT